MIQKHHIENLRSALQLFDEIADMPNMAFGFRKSGCGEAAHIIGHMMMAKHGLTQLKVHCWTMMDMAVNVP